MQRSVSNVEVHMLHSMQRPRLLNAALMNKNNLILGATQFHLGGYLQRLVVFYFFPIYLISVYFVCLSK